MDRLFATVCLIPEGGDASRGGTIRVPVTAETTVRQLAKESMHRLLLSRRSNGVKIRPVAVTEVRVGGITEEHAEIFSVDFVTQVVLLKEETVYMKLKLAEASTAGTAAAAVDHLAVNKETALPNAVPPTAVAVPGATLNAPMPPVTQVNVPAVAQLESSSFTPTAAVPAAPEAGARGNRGTTKRPRRADETWTRHPDCGPEAVTHFNPNYTSSSEVIARRLRAKTAEEKRAPATVDIDAKSPQRPTVMPSGWGPEAYKSFAANYVSSPDRLARQLRKQRRLEAAEAKKAAPAASPPARAEGTSRQLGLETDSPTQRDTVGHCVSPIVVEDEVPLPKGWGSEASKYFDPETYCDDPSKARLTFGNRSRPTRYSRASVGH